MIDILLISDQPRLHAILETTGQLPDGRLRIATSLSQGMEEMASKAPDLLFLQNRLSGLAGYLLVRHVRAETESSATRIILLTDSSGEGEPSSADIELLTAVSDNELADAVSEIIGDHLPLEKGVPVTFERSPAAPVEDKPLQLQVPEITDPVSLSQSSGPASLSSPSSPVPSGTEFQPSDSDDPGRQATILNSNPPPIQWEKQRLAVAVSIAAALLAIGLLAVFFLRSTPEQTAPKPTTVSAPPPSGIPVQTVASSNAQNSADPGTTPAVTLPSFIPTTGIDPAYRIAHPGWERYTSAAREYKVFRESGALKAIQILDRQGAGISPAFFSSVIQKLAKVRDYRTVSREIKGDFLVKKGKLSASAEIILYKNRSDTTLHAFVIYFGAQNTIPDNKGSQ